MHNLSKSYVTPEGTLPVLRQVSFEVRDGEMVALMGQSGAGKSTLLNVLGMLDQHDTGDYYLAGHPIHTFNEAEIAYHRARLIGFVFQRFHLIPFKTVLDNIALPLYYQRVPAAERRVRAQTLLEEVGLGDKASVLPNQLSGGQQQRVAIARALVGTPPLVLADEPTGALDSRTSNEIMVLLKRLHQAGNTLVIVTHDLEVAKQCERIIRIQDGQII